MKILTKTLMTLAMGLLIVGSSVGLAADTSSGANSKATAQQKTKKVKKAKKAKKAYLLVLQATQGSLEPLEGNPGHFTLVLERKAMTNVIEFSDRPYRIVKFLTIKQLTKRWSHGYNSFESDPPNAILTAAGLKAQIIMLKGMTVTKDTVSFDVHLAVPANVNYIANIDLGNSGRLENITLVLD